MHPWCARLQARAFANVERVTADLSGSFALLLGQAAELRLGLPPPCAAIEVDLVVSINLLSQLPIQPVERLENAAHGCSAYSGRRMASGSGAPSVKGHPATLSGLPARVCLVTDLDEREIDRFGGETSRLDLLYGARLGLPDQAWDWEPAPFGEAARDRRLVHRIAAHLDWQGWPVYGRQPPPVKNDSKLLDCSLEQF